MDLAAAITAAEQMLHLTLKSEQRQLIEEIVQGRDAIGILPTGYGKSLVYGLVPFVKSKVMGKDFSAIVISPLIALVEDQVSSFTVKGISCAACYGGKETGVMDVDIIFCTPEYVSSNSAGLLASLQRECCLVAVDEAHFIATWGDSFRSSYLDLGPLLSRLVGVPTAALTATLSTTAREQVIKHLMLDNPAEVALLPDRSNVYIDVDSTPGRNEAKVDFLVDAMLQNGAKAIIYRSSLAEVVRLYKFLQKRAGEGTFLGGKRYCENRRIEMYHSGVDDDRRREIEDDFVKTDSTIKILVGTTAFGVGVNVPDVEHVVVLGLPDDPLAFWQLAGRAGRDGRQSMVHLIFKPGEVETKSKKRKLTANKEMRDVVVQPGCYRMKLLKNFSLSTEGTVQLERLGEQNHQDKPSCTRHTCCSFNPCKCAARTAFFKGLNFWKPPKPPAKGRKGKGKAKSPIPESDTDEEDYFDSDDLMESADEAEMDFSMSEDDLFD